MRQTLRQIVAVLALGGIALSLVPNALAASYTDLSAANKLAASGYIVDKSANTAAYRLGDTLLRQEGVGTAAKVLGIIPDTDVADYTCANKFSDISEAWVCRAAELAAKAGLTNAANATFRPKDNLTKYEAMLFALRATCNAPEDKSVTGVAAAAVDLGIITTAASFNGTAAATRGQFFTYVATALEDSQCGDTTDEDVICTLFPALCEDDGGTPPPSSSTGDVEVTLSNDSPNGTTIPASVAGVVVASYDITASGDDVVINSIKVKRVGLGDENTLTAIALSTEDGRISKSKNENSSDDTADFALTTPLSIDAGKTVTVNVIVSVNTAAAAANDEFAIELVSLTSNAADVNIDDSTGATFRVGSVDAAGITVSDDGTTPSVKIGEIGKEVYRFKAVNGANDEEILLKSISLKENGTADDEDDFENWSLYMDGVKVATTESSIDKYVTFDLDTAAVLKSGKTHKFVVKADILGGAGKTVQLSLDNPLDVMATGTKFGFGAAVTDSSAGAAVSIQAGELVLSAVDAPADKIREDKNDVILGKIKVNNVAGKSLELQRVQVTLTGANLGALTNVSGALENVELYDEVRGNVYDLTLVAAGATEVYSDQDLAISLPAGVTTFAVRADTKNLAGGNLTAFGSATFTPSVASIGGNGFYVVETEDDQVVTDITPSSLSFKKVEGSLAGGTVTVLPLSAAKNAVIGSTDVEALAFEVKADSSSALTLTELQVNGALSADTLDNTLVTELKLYKGSISEANLLDRVSASSLAAETATFDGFNLNIAKGATQKLIVTVSIVDDAAQATDEIRLAVTTGSLNLDDEEGDDVTPTYVSLNSARTITITAAGSLLATVDNTDSVTDKAKNVLGNTTSPFVASYELTAQNEGVLIKDLEVVATEAVASDFVNSVAEVILYKNDKTTEIDRKSVTGLTTTFEDLNYTVAEGTENIYVKVVTRKIGKDEAGVQTGNLDLAIEVLDAEGAESNKVVTAPAQTAASNDFSVVPVRISTLAFVSSYGGETVATNLTNGENTVAIIAVTTDSSTNTKTTGTSLKTELESMALTVNTDALEYDTTPDAGDVSAITVKKIGGTVAAQSAARSTGVALADADALGTVGLNLFKGVALGADEEVDNGTTVYYVVKVTFSGLAAATNKYFQVKLDNLDSGSTVEYSSDNVDDNEVYGAGDNITALRIGTTSISGPSISSSY